jgi:biotin synthase
MVRLSAGRAEMSQSEQALCFMAGANSIFAGEKLLTTPNPSFEEDNLMFGLLGLKPRVAFKTDDTSVGRRPIISELATEG